MMQEKFGVKKFKKNEFSCWGHSMPRHPKWMLRHWPPASWMLQHPIRMPRYPKADRRSAVACIASARTLKYCHLILEQAFKVIPLRGVPYKSLVSAKNNKPTSLIKILIIGSDFRTYVKIGVLTQQPTSKNHIYFYTNPNQVIEKPKLHLRKSSFWKKISKKYKSLHIKPKNLRTETCTAWFNFPCFAYSLNSMIYSLLSS